MRILVTGATGHLGAHLVRDLLAHDHEVVALVRASSDRRGIEGLDIEVVAGDLLDPASLVRATKRCDQVFHAGAVYRNFAANPDDILRPARDGTENVLRAAAESGVKRVVHTSSNATIGYGRDTTPLDESHHNTDQRTSPYIDGKCLAEDLALGLGPTLGLEVVVLNPSGILGPLDYRSTPTTRAAIGLATGGPSLLDIGITHVADVAAAHRLAAERGTPGERYVLVGENLTKEQLAEAFNAVTGNRSKPASPPGFLIWTLALGMEVGARLTGGDADLTRATYRDAWGCKLWYDATKAREELGWKPLSGAEVVRDTVRWLAFRGLLGKRNAAIREALPADPSWRP